ncbi:MAG: glycosyltransferase, partial [Thermoplasmata archaeon]|nr:glycosyltransferase [Thermoplasmata archaeon]
MVDVSVVIPTRNEEASIGRVLEEVREALQGAGRTYEMLVVDTVSEDRTVAIAEERGARVVPEARRGYG